MVMPLKHYEEQDMEEYFLYADEDEIDELIETYAH